jgi:hypothetical protein
MSVTVGNLVLGPATLYVGAFGAAEPADTAVNASPQASAWTDLGGTQGGTRFSLNLTYTDLDVDQIVDVPGSRLTKREIVISTNLAEPTLANLMYSQNSNSTTPTTGAGFASFEPAFDTSATQPTYRAFLLDGIAPGGFRRRLILRRALSKANVEAASAKDGQTVIPVEFHGFYVSASIAPYKIVDQTS